MSKNRFKPSEDDDYLREIVINLKKHNAEEDKYNGLLQASKELKMLYDAYVEAGFDEGQAMVLISTVLISQLGENK